MLLEVRVEERGGGRGVGGAGVVGVGQVRDRVVQVGGRGAVGQVGGEEGVVHRRRPTGVYTAVMTLGRIWLATISATEIVALRAVGHA